MHKQTKKKQNKEIMLNICVGTFKENDAKKIKLLNEKFVMCWLNDFNSFNLL